MSVIAKSLKRLREHKKPEFSISGSTVRSISISSFVPLFYIMMIAIFIVAVFVYAYASFESANKKISNVNFPSIEKLQSKLDYEKRLAINVKMQPKGLEDLFVLKKFYKMFEIAKERNNLKFEGLYYFEENDLNRAYSLFKKYLERYPNDYVTKTYLALILYRQKRYNEAINMLNAIKIKNCNLVFDRAVIYEASGRYKEALDLYKKAYSQCKNPIVESRIRKKIIVLEYYLRNINES